MHATLHVTVSIGQLVDPTLLGGIKGDREGRGRESQEVNDIRRRKKAKDIRRRVIIEGKCESMQR